MANVETCKEMDLYNIMHQVQAPVGVVARCRLQQDGGASLSAYSTKDRQSHRRCYGPLPRGSALQVAPVHHNGAFAWPDLRTTLCTELPPLLLGGWVLGAGAACAVLLLLKIML